MEFDFDFFGGLHLFGALMGASPLCWKHETQLNTEHSEHASKVVLFNSIADLRSRFASDVEIWSETMRRWKSYFISPKTIQDSSENPDVDERGPWPMFTMSSMSKEWRVPLCVSSSVDHSPCICIVLFYLVIQYIVLPCWHRLYFILYCCILYIIQCSPPKNTLYLHCTIVFGMTYNTKSSTTVVTAQNCPPSTYGTFACKIPPPSLFCCSKCSLL